MKKSFNLFVVLLRCGSGLPVVRDVADYAKLAANRAKLRKVMIRNSFEPLPSEWWLYDFSGWQRFEILDIGLEELPAENH